MRLTANDLDHPAITAPRHSRRKPVSGNGFRPEVQGLRAIAVLSVVLFHLWPEQLTGGYAGVDVFFVISGFLITAHLFREFSHHSRVILTIFWARRIRRLLPAALFVLAASVIGTYLWVPSTLWQASARQITASAIYLQNWVLAADAVDYSAMHKGATVAQHYWSLSVEEQFYVAWPLLLSALFLAAAQVWARLPRGRHAAAMVAPARAVFIVGLAGVGLLSLVYSIYITATDPASAYFVTPARVWEFAAGGLTALIFKERQFRGPLATTLAWVGVGMIATTMVTFDASTPFPGFTALLPVVGCALVLTCCGDTTPLSPQWFLSRRPMTFLGGVSYSLYLWHWPLIVVLPFALGHDLSTMDRIAIVLVSIAAAWVTKVVLEDPLRRGHLLRRPWRTYAFAIAGGAAVAVMCFTIPVVPTATADVSKALMAQPCHGPGALTASNRCTSVTGVGAPVPSTGEVILESPICLAPFEGSALVSCTYGASASTATKKVAIVGDSHAAAWVPALIALAKLHRWQVVTYTKTSCPVSFALRVLPNEKTNVNQSNCAAWVDKLNQSLMHDPSISTVFTASFSSAYTFASRPGNAMGDPAVDGFTQLWAGWQKAGKKVDVFDDVPRTLGSDVPTCLATYPAKPMTCATPLATALPANMNISRAAAEMVPHGVKEISLRNRFCDTRWCYPQVGSIVVYRDFSHISNEYSRALAPYIDPQL